MSSVESLEPPSDYIFLQDNDPKHIAKSTKQWLSENNVNVLQWPSQYPDLNPIGNLWRFMKIQIRKRATVNINNLKTICQEEWYKIPTNYWKKLIENYRKRLVAVEVNKVYSTKYQMKIINYFYFPGLLAGPSGIRVRWGIKQWQIRGRKAPRFGLATFGWASCNLCRLCIALGLAV